MWTMVIENTAVAAGLAGLVALTCLFNRRRPAICHLAWLLVLVVLVMPPLPLGVDSPGGKLRQALSGWLPQGSPVDGLSATQARIPPALEVTTGPRSELLASAAPAIAADAGASSHETMATAVLRRLSALSLSTWALLIWGAGASVVLLRLAHRMWAFHVKVRAAPPAPPALVESVTRVAHQLGVAAPQVRLLEGVGTPSVWCLGRPTLLWPTEGGELLESAREPSLIAHELAHLARRDHWVAWFEMLAKISCWWNPLFWIIRRQVRSYAELSCDAWATWAFPAERRVYAEALIDAQARSIHAPMALQGLCATDTEFRDFERRLSMIMKQEVSKGVPAGVAVVALLATALVFPIASDAGEGRRSRAGESETSIAELVETKKLFEKAEKLYKNEQSEEALELFREVLRLDPEHGLAHARVGYILASQGSPAAAVEHFQREIALEHGVATATYNVACMQSLAGDGEAALAALQKAVRLGFANADLLKKDTDLATIRGSAAFDAALAAAAKSAQLRKKLDMANAKGGGGEVLELYEALSAIVSDDGKLAHDHGLRLLENDRTVEAAAAFTRQVELGYAVGNGYYNRACALARSGDSGGSIRDLNQAVKHGMSFAGVRQDEDLASLRGDPRFEKLERKLSASKMRAKEIQVALEAGDQAGAEAELEKLIASRRSDKKIRGWAHDQLGTLLLESGRYNEAIAAYSRALAQGFPAEKVAFQIATAHAAMGQDELALTNFNHALDLGFAESDTMTDALQAWEVGDEATRSDLIKRAEKAQKWKTKKKLKKKSYAIEKKKDAALLKREKAGQSASREPTQISPGTTLF